MRALLHEVIHDVQNEERAPRQVEDRLVLPAREEQLLEVERVNRLELLPVVKLHSVEREERFLRHEVETRVHVFLPSPRA